MTLMKSLVTILLSLVFVLGCSKSQNPESKQAQPTTAAVSHETAVDKNTLGEINGVVLFKGAVPRLPKLDMTQDPACPADPQPSDAVVVNNGKLANVFVYVKNGKGLAPTFGSPAVLDQKGCRYVPHVMGLMVNQPLQILNNDNALHNVHPMPKNNEEWNESQMPRGQPIVKTFSHPELMMPITCNQHPWMRMYVNVMDNPFFTVSDSNGSFQINSLAPGEYTLVAIHEKFGQKEMHVTVSPKQTSKAEFVFSAQ